FRAEDGIRDLIVTGVQTCALPISYGKLHRRGQYGIVRLKDQIKKAATELRQIDPFPRRGEKYLDDLAADGLVATAGSDATGCIRSEERRVGKEWRSGCARAQYM